MSGSGKSANVKLIQFGCGLILEIHSLDFGQKYGCGWS